MQANWLDRAIGWLAPRLQLRRARARAQLNIMARQYEGAELTRRTQGWRSPGSDPNATGVTLRRLRDSARDMVRNNGHAESAMRTLVDDTVGTGIVPSARHDRWKAWAGSTDIDADGLCDLAGLEELVMRTVIESGECLIRRRMRRLSDGLPIPMQLQVLEPDFIDSSKHGSLRNGGKIVHGVEFSPIGRREAYHLYREHPGARSISSNPRIGESVRVPASEILHIFAVKRPGQVRGASWFAPVLLRFHDYDEFADATLMKQKVAALLAVITSDHDGGAARLGAEDSDNEAYDSLEPGMILNVDPGKTVDVVQPPSVRDFAEYSEATLREIAAGIGVTYEDLTGDYTNLPFSAARMSRLRHWGRITGWRRRMLIPLMLNPVWRWASMATQIMGDPMPGSTTWTAPPLPMIDPDKEGLAVTRNIRAGITTHSEAIRERGWNPDEFLDEYEEDMGELDSRGLVLDIDARKMTQAGQRHTVGAGGDGVTAELDGLLPAQLRDADGNGAGARA